MQFERIYRPSAAATRSRIGYLFPAREEPAALARYLAEFSKLLDLARQSNIRVVVIKMPAPLQFRSQLPGEADFDRAMSDLLRGQGITFNDLSAELNEARFYSDTDHLNRNGIAEFFARHLKPVLGAPFQR